MPKKKRLNDESDNVSASEAGKKPFDKAKWREKKYSKKFKVEQWEERRKKAALYKYYKDLRKEDPTFQRPETQKINGNSLASAGKGKHASAYSQAMEVFNRKKAEKEAKKIEIERQNTERIEALNQYRIKKAERFKKLSKKTKRGQPVMKDRIELLLEKIQNQRM